MSDLDVYASGSWYNPGTHQREPVLHVRNGSLTGALRNGGNKPRGGGKSGGYLKGIEGSPAAIYGVLILIFAVVIVLYLIVGFSIKGVRAIKAKRAAKAHRSEGKGTTILPTDIRTPLPVGGMPTVPRQPTRVELLVWPDQAEREKAEAEDEYDAARLLAGLERA